ncbi:MAG: hypothetical protein LBD20_06045 [Spirochaetaceae bacterium]|jgi:hypothetical protein|nr:hypothetical protein [Spirochaetaceae bacterium]
MKRIVFVFALLAALTAAAFAADTLYCKWCGSSSFGSLRQMITSPCSRSPTGKHEPYQGAARRFYVCSFCATESSNFTQLVTTACNKSPSKYHQAYEGAEKTSYTCKYCGTESRSFKQLVLSPCNKSPRKYHDAL